MLKLDRLSRRYGSTVALGAVTLDVPAGQMVGVIGPAGAGKSTLLRLMARMIDPSDGCLGWGDTILTPLAGRDLRAWRAACAWVGPQPKLADHLDVVSNVMMGRGADGPAWRAMTQIYTPRDRARALAALDRVGLAPIAAQRAGGASLGQRRRIAIARALMHRPRVLVIDDAVTDLGRSDGLAVLAALRATNRHDGTTIVCSLSQPDLARDACDRILGLSGGRIVFDGAAPTLSAPMAQALCETAVPAHRDPWAERAAPALMSA